jgi:hypothetical protein
MGIGCGQVGQPSVTMARAASSCKATRASNLLFEHDPEGRCRLFRTMFKVKKRAVKLGGPHRPLTFRRRGADSTGRNLRERALGPPPERAVGGGDYAGDTFHLVKTSISAFRQRNRDEAR